MTSLQANSAKSLCSSGFLLCSTCQKSLLRGEHWYLSQKTQVCIVLAVEDGTFLNIKFQWTHMPFGSGCEAASASKVSRAGAFIIELMNYNDAFWEVYMTCIVFCRITYTSVTLHFHYWWFQKEAFNMRGVWQVQCWAEPANSTHQWTWKLHGAIPCLSVDVWSLKPSEDQ